MNTRSLSSLPSHSASLPRLCRCLALAAVLGLTGCAHSGLSRSVEPTRALAFDPDTSLARIDREQAHGRMTGQSTVYPVASGPDALALRLALVAAAQRSVDLQYYIYRPDASGMGLAAALWSAAERGVRVRILLDDWGARPSDEALSRLASHPRIEVRLFNPIRLRGWPLLGMLLDFDQANRRMHNKLMVVDNVMAIMGGRNIGNEYFDRGEGFDFGDLDLLVSGQEARRFSQGFDGYWNSRWSASIVPGGEQHAGPPHVPASALLEAARTEANLDTSLRMRLRPFHAAARAVQDDPEKIALDEHARGAVEPLEARIGRLIGQARRHLLIVSPYFIPGEGGLERLRAMRESGVRVSIVTNSLVATDVPVVHAAYAKYRKRLLRMGVELYEIRDDAARVQLRLTAGASSAGSGLGSSRQSLHAKMMVVDHRVLFVGSMNIDPRSVRLNTENGVVVHDAELARTLAEGTLRALESHAYRLVLEGDRLLWVTTDGGVPVRHDREPRTTRWQRFGMWLMSVLVSDEYL